MEPEKPHAASEGDGEVDDPRWAADRGVCARLRAGDPEAFAQLIDSLHRPLLRIAEAYVGRGGGAEDLVQDTWAKVVDHIGEFEGRAALRTWITRILVNAAMTRKQRDKRSVSLDDGMEEEVEARFSSLGLWTAMPTIARGPEDALLQKEAANRLKSALESLPEVQRAVVTLRDVDDWTSEEVCNALGLSESNQRVLLHRGRQKLRAVLERASKGQG